MGYRRCVVTVTLRHSETPVWRRVRMEGTMPLDAVHQVLQGAMGWEDRHLFMFRAGDKVFYDEVGRDPQLDLRANRLMDILPVRGSRGIYVYDMGDNWQHDLVVDEVTDSDGWTPAVLIAGDGGCPREDSGPENFLGRPRRCRFNFRDLQDGIDLQVGAMTKGLVMIERMGGMPLDELREQLMAYPDNDVDRQASAARMVLAERMAKDGFGYAATGA